MTNRLPFIRTLHAQDSCDAYQLFCEVFSSTPYGFLAQKSLDDFHRVLGDEISNLSSGVFEDNKLIAYQLCAIAPECPFPGAGNLEKLYRSGLKICCSLGLVIHPNYQSRGLGKTLAHQRREIMREKGIGQLTALIDRNNIHSVFMHMKLGTTLIDFFEDSTSLNYVIMQHEKSNSGNVASTRTVQYDDFRAQSQLFSKAWAATRYEHSSGRLHLTFEDSNTHVKAEDAKSQEEPGTLSVEQIN